MNNLDMLKRQHREILVLVKDIESSISTEVDSKSVEIARNINILSGKMKMHLMAEDQFIYPDLERNSNPKIRATAKQFNHEMGDLSEEFAAFVQKYNIPNKITSSKIVLDGDSRMIFKKIRERINKEDVDLYPLLSR